MTITTNGESIEATSSADWLTIKQGNGGKFTVTAEESDEYSSRTAKIVINIDSAEYKVIAIQEKQDLLVFGDEAGKDLMDRTGYTCGGEGTGLTSFAVNFQTNGDFTVELPWWMSADECESKNGYYKAQYVKVRANYADEVRKGSVVFRLGDLSFKIDVTQKPTVFDFSAVNRPVSEIAADMKLGWNLGGVYDGGTASTVSESGLQVLLDSGINVVRIPCSWREGHIDASTGAIDAAWLKNVSQMIDKVLAKDMYAIINIDEDGGWISNNTSYSDTATLFPLFESTWTQIANAMIEYGDHLIFEGYGALGGVSSDTTLTEEKQTVSRRLNELFLQAVRRSGANNYKRSVIIPSYGQNVVTATRNLTLPEDVVEDRLMVGVQFFEPQEYALTGEKKYWGDAYTSYTEYVKGYPESKIKSLFTSLAEKFVGTPIVLTSYGSISHTDDKDSNMLDAEEQYIAKITKIAKNLGITTILWDDGVAKEGGFGIFNRADEMKTVRTKYFAGVKEGLK